MNKGLIFFVFFLLFSNNVIAYESKPVIRASVSKDFVNGLQAKYIKYIAEQLSLDLKITIMPFARRLFELKQGNLDIMVGVNYSEDREQDLVYIYPPYNSQSSSFFSLTDNKDEIKNYSDLHNKTIGIIRGNIYFHRFDNDLSLKKSPAIHIQQSIEMLLHRRIDLFIHNQESALLKLAEMGVENLISTTSFQPDNRVDEYLVISAKSELIKLKPQFTAVIEKAVRNGDFAKIRMEHYRQPNLPLAKSREDQLLREKQN